ncbi:MAG: MaoC family dehydratase N-terminal domain-containing protein [Leptospiraceae bacterium]|nr:MaoC family dehydratase N-terminal domain-containing protein [Leptospiraceae bacterium]
MASMKVTKFEEQAPGSDWQADKVDQPEYGRYLEDFRDGDVFVHPRAFTIDRSFAQEYATVFHEANPVFLSAPVAQANGFADMPVHPMMVFNIALCLGVQNNSEKAMANLGYYQVNFLQAVYPGDSLTARSKVLSKRDRGPDKPGIVHVSTICQNQTGAVVLMYERKIMVPPRGDGAPAQGGDPAAAFPLPAEPQIQLPEFKAPDAETRLLTGSNTYFEDFSAGQIIIHKNMRTITDEHVPWTYRMGNTHPLHYDRIYSMGLSGKMSGEPIVYGGLVFGWLIGLSSRDLTENMIWDLGYTEGYHTNPAVSGDTVGSISRILSTTEGPVPGTGILQVQLIGVKNIATKVAFEKYGADLFIKEGDKKGLGKEKISDKIFEIERKILIKKRP